MLSSPCALVRCPASPLVAMVPMLVGATDGRHDAHVAGLVVPLPTNVADPAERLQRTNLALAEAKRRRVAVAASMMQDVSMFAPPALAALAGRLVGALPHRSLVSPTVNLALTNVPGSRQQMYLAGRPLEVSYPVLTINELSPLHIGLQSGPGVIGVGGLVCRDDMTDLDALLERLPVELVDLGRATGVRASRSARASNAPAHARPRRRSPGSCRPSNDEVVDERTTGRAFRVSWNDRVTPHRRLAIDTTATRSGSSPSSGRRGRR